MQETGVSGKGQEGVRAGNLYINRDCNGTVIKRYHFNGLKMSGVGSKYGGRDYLLQFTVPGVVTGNTIKRGFAPAEVGDE